MGISDCSGALPLECHHCQIPKTVQSPEMITVLRPRFMNSSGPGAAARTILSSGNPRQKKGANKG